MSASVSHPLSGVQTDIISWINSIRRNAAFSVKEITLEQATDWLFENGMIHHSSHRFFNIIGIKHNDFDNHVRYQPLIEQREIGTLGFLWRSSNGIPELLVHAKIEPGNTGVVQIAPSCQATESNADRVHGGEIPPFSELFDTNEVDVISSTLQSEQGSRFLGKLNRNVLASLKTDLPLNSPIHKWVPVDELLKMLTDEYLLNTDARSVLVCSDWEKLVARKPFTSDNSLLSRELATSFSHEGLFESVKKVKKRITQLRKKIAPPTVISLRELPEYSITNYGIYPKNKKPFAVKYIDVQTAYREVKRWNQPIIESAGTGKIDLTCARIDGVLHFLFKPITEPGLLHKVELSTSEAIEPGEDLHNKKEERIKGKILIQSWQSDEGGRFYHDKSLYRIIDAGNAYSVPDEWTWLSLKQVKYFLDEGGWLTNEARSALSLLLTWL